MLCFRNTSFPFDHSQWTAGDRSPQWSTMDCEMKGPSCHQERKRCVGGWLRSHFIFPAVFAFYLFSIFLLPMPLALSHVCVCVARDGSASYLTHSPVGTPGAGIMEADDRHVRTVFTVQPLFQNRHPTNPVSCSVTIVGERRGDV